MGGMRSEGRVAKVGSTTYHQKFKTFHHFTLLIFLIIDIDIRVMEFISLYATSTGSFFFFSAFRRFVIFTSWKEKKRKENTIS